MAADLDRASRVEWSAGEVQDEREKEEHNIQYAVYVHEGGGELHDMQKLEDGTQEENNFQITRAARWEHVAAKSQEGAAQLCQQVRYTEEARTYER